MLAVIEILLGITVIGILFWVAMIVWTWLYRLYKGL